MSAHLTLLFSLTLLCQVNVLLFLSLQDFYSYDMGVIFFFVKFYDVYSTFNLSVFNFIQSLYICGCWAISMGASLSVSEVRMLEPSSHNEQLIFIQKWFKPLDFGVGVEAIPCLQKIDFWAETPTLSCFDPGGSMQLLSLNSPRILVLECMLAINLFIHCFQLTVPFQA